MEAWSWTSKLTQRVHAEIDRSFHRQLQRMPALIHAPVVGLGGGAAENAGAVRQVSESPVRCVCLQARNAHSIGSTPHPCLFRHFAHHRCRHRRRCCRLSRRPAIQISSIS